MLFLANEEHLAILKKGVDIWNQWRRENPSIKPELREARLVGANLSDVNLFGADLLGAILIEANLSGANLREAILQKANLSKATLVRAHLNGANLRWANLFGADLNAYFIKADLSGANLVGANLVCADLNEANLYGAQLKGANLNRAFLVRAHFFGADLSEANLSEATLNEVNLTQANLSRANLIGACLCEANLSESNLKSANLSKAILSYTRIIRAKLNGAILTDCRIFGISAWGVEGLAEAEQSNLIITPEDEPTITVDNLEVAQFIYLMLNSEKIRNVLDTIASKAVLILGRFTPERKAVLEAIREELRKRNYLPILFDFEKPASKDLTETVSTLAHMARFVIADLTEAKSIPQELMVIVPNLPSVPVQPILLSSEREYGMFEHFKKYPWVLGIYKYDNLEDLLKNIAEKVIKTAEQKVKEQREQNQPPAK